MYQYRIYRSTIAQLVTPVCNAIYDVLAREYISFPKTEEWIGKINETYERWQFSNNFAGADGNHFGILALITLDHNIITTRASLA